MIKTVLFISDLLLPLWLVILMFLLKKKGISTWKAWGISSIFCLAQAYLVAKMVGWNLGGYLIVIISSIPAMILGKEKIAEGLTSVLFWTLPALIFVIIPVVVLYFLENKER